MKTKRTILILFLFTLVIRVAASFYFYQQNDVKSFEFGALAENLVAGNGYSLFYHGELYFPDEKTNVKDGSAIKPEPSAYMMPGYPFFLAAMMMLFGDNPYLAVFLLQAFLAACIAVLIYKLTLQFARKSVALLAAGIYIFLPEMIYTTISIGPTVFIHFLVLIVLYILTKNSSASPSIRDSIIIGFVLALLLYMRPAIAMFIIVLLSYLFIKRYFSQFLIISIVVIACLSPWIARNYMVWNKFVPFTTTTGMNLYRGHNPYYPGFWQTKEIEEEIDALPESKDFELKMRDVFMSHALKEIRLHPVKEIMFSLKKLMYLWGYYPYDSRTQNLFYLIPWLILLAFFILAFFGKFDFKQKKYIYFYLLSSSINAVLFFALLRYQTLMKIAVIPLAAQGIVLVWDIYKNKK